jgi:hypothetical protein
MMGLSEAIHSPKAHSRFGWDFNCAAQPHFGFQWCHHCWSRIHFHLTNAKVNQLIDLQIPA